MSGSTPKLRREARLSGVQALYQMDVANAKSKQVIYEFLNHRFGYEGENGMVTADEKFFEELVEGVVREQDQIDAKLDAQLPDKWPLRRLDMTLRALLRAGVFEITQRPDVPALVIIDEYVAIASDFFSGKEPGMVNAVMDKIARAVRSAEFGLPLPASISVDPIEVSDDADTSTLIDDADS
ncbi:N utilization substance protein B [Algimonas arctica]|uniref:Transcription antitermination protein NusB n=1 Tax=Algimonas arctica TaxID=1479486 RepID=A0A8J3CQA0_9PROT|nr:transcription antitermination factor NusB [Algimonas arctica]GHA83766.1 N utilization substance protein B [Algimonas arctica]